MKKLLILINLIVFNSYVYTVQPLSIENINQKQAAIAAEIQSHRRQVLAAKVIIAVGISGVIGYKIWESYTKPDAPIIDLTVKELDLASLTAVVRAQDAELKALRSQIDLSKVISWGAWFKGQATNIAALFMTTNILVAAQNYYDYLFCTPSLSWYIKTRAQFPLIIDQIKLSLEKLNQGNIVEQENHVKSLEVLYGKFVEQAEYVCGFMAYEVEVLHSKNSQDVQLAHELQQQVIVTINQIVQELNGLQEHIAGIKAEKAIVDKILVKRCLMKFNNFEQDFKHMIGLFMLYQN